MKTAVLPEIVATGIYNSQHVAKNRSISPNRKTAMFEIELPIEDGGISYIGNTPHAITQNLVICAKPGQMRHTQFPFKCYYIHMIVSDEQLCNMLMSLPDFIEISFTERIRNVFEKLCEIYDVDTYENNLLIYSLIFELAFLLNKYSYNSKSMGQLTNNRKIIDQTIEYINDNITTDLSLEKIAAEMNFTPTYFHKLFKSSTGKNLREYIEEQRIKKSINLMISTDMTLTQIAYECGFSSQSYFSYAFKRKMKLSPREYVKLTLKKYDE